MSVRKFVWAGLGLSLILGTFASPFASSAPDGLERTAEKLGFAAMEESSSAAVRRVAPLPDYAVPGVADERAATGLAGLLGTLAVFVVALGAGALLARRAPPAGFPAGTASVAGASKESTGKQP